MSTIQSPQTSRALRIMAILRTATKGMADPASKTIVETYGRDPYLVLISCLLSLRTKDTVSLPASIRLFALAKTPQEMLALPLPAIEKAIYPCGFYRNKAANLHSISQELLDRFAGKVPDTAQELMSLKGVGLKTANLVLSEGFGIPALCVDVHVHRISNRLGLVKTTTPEETEAELRRILPSELWIDYTRLLVMWGQNLCVPVSPFCSKCPVFNECMRVGVDKKR